MRRHYWLIPLAALVAVAPIALGPPLCGKDIAFHVQSWFDAAAQLRHGTLYPRWTFAAAYNGGEPRFAFYPPISWMLGGLLALLLPMAAVPVVLAWVALTAAGFAMHRLASTYATPAAALLAACGYLANPFLVFSVVARAAYGEIFAAALCPLLLSAMLAEPPSVWAIAAPLAGMALSNVPGGILGGYVFVLLAAGRIALTGRADRRRLLATFAVAPVAAMGLAAVYLLPAVYERPLIRMADAFPPGMRPGDNLLLHRTLLAGRDDFLMEIERIALLLAVAVVVALAVAWRRRAGATEQAKRAGQAAAALSVVVAFSVTWLSAPLWRMLPALWVVQFPWRGLFVLATCMGLAVALALRSVPLAPAALVAGALALTAALATPAVLAWRQPCAAGDAPADFVAALKQHHTPEPTDEYVPAHAHLGAYRPDNPPFWLADDAAAYAPGTTPNRIDLDASAAMPAVPPGARLSATPLRFRVSSARAGYLVVNLEDYPRWRVKLDGVAVARIPRADGLIAIAVPAGVSEAAIVWQAGWDEWVGGLVSCVTVLMWIVCVWRRVAGLKPGTSERQQRKISL